MPCMGNRRKVLGFFQVVMINVIAVDSIRNLPFSATYGFSLVFFYLFAGLCFFIPGALVSAELGTGWPTTGGIYVWVREAFGKKIGLLVIWLNWIYNIFWYPTIMALIAGALAYLFDPALAQNKLYMATTVILLFWGVTLVNCFGIRLSSFFSTLAALVGTLLPMGVIILLGILWMVEGRPMQIQFTWEEFFPSIFDYSNIAYLTNVLFGLIGLEMSATHAEEMHLPKRTYPRSILVSVIIIFLSVVLSSLAIAAVVPPGEINLVVGMVQAFVSFVEKLDLPWLLPLIVGSIVLGGLGGAGAWIIGPTRGIMVASRDGSLPPQLMTTNRYGAPITMLIVQAIVVTILSIGYVFLSSVENSFWYFSLVSAQLALVVYILLFASAIALHHRKRDVHRAFKIPGGTWGIWITSCLGIFTCALVIVLGFVPPTHTPIKHPALYVTTLLVGMIVLVALPFAFARKQKTQ
jgi:amino acid transporter